MEPTTKQTEPSNPAPLGIIIPASKGDENKKRFKVGMIFVGADCKTVFADNPQQAMELVQGGKGLAAGYEEPQLIGIQCYEMDKDTKAKSFVKMFMGMFLSMQQQMQPKTKPGIIVPKLSPPTDILKEQ